MTSASSSSTLSSSSQSTSSSAPSSYDRLDYGVLKSTFNGYLGTIPARILNLYKKKFPKESVILFEKITREFSLVIASCSRAIAKMPSEEQPMCRSYYLEGLNDLIKIVDEQPENNITTAFKKALENSLSCFKKPR